jgi:hypothetical protein
MQFSVLHPISSRGWQSEFLRTGFWMSAHGSSCSVDFGKSAKPASRRPVHGRAELGPWFHDIRSRVNALWRVSMMS